MDCVVDDLVRWVYVTFDPSELELLIVVVEGFELETIVTTTLTTVPRLYEVDLMNIGWDTSEGGGVGSQTDVGVVDREEVFLLQINNIPPQILESPIHDLNEFVGGPEGGCGFDEMASD